jgi:hypothetical protein
MKVIFVSVNDWGNVGHLFAKSMRKVGVDAKAVIKNPHPFNYPEHAELYEDLTSLQTLIKDMDVIVFMHTKWPGQLDLIGKRVVVFHGGSVYRKNKIGWNSFWNPKVDITLIQTSDLMGYGAKNEILFPPPVDEEMIKPMYEQSNPGTVVFAHFPRIGVLKGSQVIVNSIRKIRRDGTLRQRMQFNYTKARVSWLENLKRMSTCDVYIESQQYMQGSQPLCEWGMTALEAAALGKIVVTCFQGRENYERRYGTCPIYSSNTPNELLKVVKHLIGMPTEELIEKKQQSRQWIETQHGLKATGERLKKVLLA